MQRSWVVKVAEGRAEQGIGMRGGWWLVVGESVGAGKGRRGGARPPAHPAPRPPPCSFSPSPTFHVAHVTVAASLPLNPLCPLPSPLPSLHPYLCALCPRSIIHAAACSCGRHA